MASSLLIFALIAFVSLISPAISQTCSSQNVTASGRTSFDSCLDLPVLGSYLHHSYNASNSSLSVAFLATPPTREGWVAWAINPTARAMLGSQAFVAFRSRGGVPIVKTYNISSYALREGRLSFDFWNLRSESMADGKIAIYVSVKVPEGADRVNQVWQIGANVTNEQPMAHAMTPENLRSTAVLSLNGGDAGAPGVAPSPGTGGSVTPGGASGPGGSNTPGEAGGPGSGGSLVTNVNAGVNLGLLILLGTILIFWN